MAGGSDVLVTRPEPGATQSAGRLEAMGLAAAVVPLTEIVAQQPEISADQAAGAGGAVVTSANAVRHAPDWLVQSLHAIPLYTVGSATAAVARERGFSDVISADGAVDDLVALVSRRVAPATRLVYLAGARRTGDLEGKLTRAGYGIDLAEVYATKEVSRLTEKLDDAFSRGVPAIILFHSALSSRLFSRYAAEHISSQAIEKTEFLAISERVAAPLPAAWNDRIHVARKPTEGALMELAGMRMSAAKR